MPKKRLLGANQREETAAKIGRKDEKSAPQGKEGRN
jgi:hypothetical protein